MRRIARAAIVGMTLFALAGVTACSDDTRAVPVPPAASASPTPSGTPASPKDGPPTDEPKIKNDLKNAHLNRTLHAGPLTVRVRYSTSLKLSKWEPGISKPLKMVLTAQNRRKKKQKIYLTKVTVAVTPYDESGSLDAPENLVDPVKLDPGYIVTQPNTYNQTFLLSSVDQSAIRQTIYITYEFAQQVAQTRNNRDFAKQVATDSIRVPLAQ